MSEHIYMCTYTPPPNTNHYIYMLLIQEKQTEQQRDTEKAAQSSCYNFKLLSQKELGYKLRYS